MTQQETLNQIIEEWATHVYIKGQSSVNYKDINSLHNLLEAATYNNIESQRLSITVNPLCPNPDGRKAFALTSRIYSELQHLDNDDSDIIMGYGYNHVVSDDDISKRY